VRIVRIVRIFRIIRMFDFFRELRILVLAIASALKSLMWALCLLCFIMYVVAVILTFGAAEAAKTDSTLNKHYGGLFKCMYTLWMSITGGISWIEVAEPLAPLGIGYPIVFNVFIGFVQIAVLNVVTGVFCENAIESAARDEDDVMQEHVKRKEEFVTKLTTVFQDCLQSGGISVTDFECKMELESMRLYFETLHLPVGNVRTLFRLLDDDGSGLISIDEFVTGCLNLRGPAKSVDVAEIIQTLGRLQVALTKNTAMDAQMEQKMEQLGAIVLAVKADVKAIAAQVNVNANAIAGNANKIAGNANAIAAKVDVQEKLSPSSPPPASPTTAYAQSPAEKTEVVADTARLSGQKHFIPGEDLRYHAFVDDHFRSEVFGTGDASVGPGAVFRPRSEAEDIQL